MLTLVRESNGMRELDFNTDYSELVDYVADKLLLAEMGDVKAMSYIEFLWDYDSDLLADAQDLVLQLDNLEYYYEY